MSTFQEYFLAKRAVDHRSLNPRVWAALGAAVAPRAGPKGLNVLELGCGVGAMFQRLVGGGVLRQARYTAVDGDADNLDCALSRLPGWSREEGLACQVTPDGAVLEGAGRELSIRLVTADVFAFLDSASTRPDWDLVVAHALLDVVDAPGLLARLARLCRPGCLVYLPIHYDGLTCFEPQIDAAWEETLWRLYHHSMDTRPAGGSSQTGRRLYTWLREAGFRLLEAGAADWMVFPRDGAYTPDERLFLDFILDTIDHQLTGHPELDDEAFAGWLSLRRAQVERQELMYVAHQMDYLACLPE
ncbi:MAG: class I SAM-dependent methyltransferase [Anaerolineaceae bacterium]|nr:class I SAM-dependent methyltransferase [Anaerolineaceae bacterium]